jgi:Conserved TM helix
MGITTALGNAFGKIVGFIPNLIAALVILAVGFLIAMALERITRRLLSAVGLDRRPWARRWLGEGAGIQRLPTTAGRIVYWVTALITIGVSIGALNLPWLSAGFAHVIAYLPNVLAAAAVVAVGYVVANFLYRETAARSRGTVLWARLVRGAILAVAGFMALQQLGIATAIVTTLFTVVISAMAVAGALAFGLGNRELAGRITRDWYERLSAPRYRRYDAGPQERPGIEERDDEDRPLDIPPHH